jgi:protein SCO1/2
MKNSNTTSAKILNFLILAAVILLAGILIGKGSDIGLFEKDVNFPTATVLDVPVPLQHFSLLDHNGEEFGRFSLVRKWTFIFFGYTNCPDICPTALIDMNGIYNNLVEKDKLGNTQFIFVSVDPARDTVEQMKEYVPFFNENFIGVTGDPEVIESISAPLGVAYTRMPGKNDDDYLVDHSASLLLIDPLGRLRAIFLPPHAPEAMAEDFIKIRKKYAEECCINP